MKSLYGKNDFKILELVISEDFLFTIVYNGATGTIELK